jgi:glycolate oxidase FAD binding subunit
LTIDSLPVPKTLRPESIEELAEIVSTERGAITPMGAGTQMAFGNPLRRLDCAIDLTRLSRITEYNPADLTIHVESGVTLEQLEHALLENNQFLPLDPWNGPAATIGGITAANAQGPFRAAGTIRDWIIGMKVVEADGRISKAGGRVVKNVTGYDLQKLYTGSLGTLAVIAEISLKLRAKFGRTATAIARLENRDAAARLLSSLRKGVLQPVTCEWVGPANEIWLRFGEHPSAVEWQLKNLPAADWKIVDAGEEAESWEGLRKRYNQFGPVVMRVVGRPTDVNEIIGEYQPGAWVAHALNGIVLMQISAAEIGRIRAKYRGVIEKAPIDVRREIPTFGLNDMEYELAKKMKDAYDPGGRLNPGRHVDGERF